MHGELNEGKERSEIYRNFWVWQEGNQMMADGILVKFAPIYLFLYAHGWFDCENSLTWQL